MPSGGAPKLDFQQPFPSLMARMSSQSDARGVDSPDISSRSDGRRASCGGIGNGYSAVELYIVIYILKLTNLLVRPK